MEKEALKQVHTYITQQHKDAFDVFCNRRGTKASIMLRGFIIECVNSDE